MTETMLAESVGMWSHLDYTWAVGTCNGCDCSAHVHQMLSIRSETSNSIPCECDSFDTCVEFPVDIDWNCSRGNRQSDVSMSLRRCNAEY